MNSEFDSSQKLVNVKKNKRKQGYKQTNNRDENFNAAVLDSMYQEDTPHLFVFGNMAEGEITVIERKNALQKEADGKTHFNLDSKVGLGDIAITQEDIQCFLDKGKSDKETEIKIREFFAHQEKIIAIQRNTNLSEQEKHQLISLAIQENAKNLPLIMDAMRNLISTVKSDSKEDKMPKKFKAGIDKGSFATPKTIMDRIPYLPKLLEKSELKRYKDGSYKVLSSIQAGAMGTIGLEYTVPFMDDKTPEQIHERYKQVMIEDAMGTYLACWDYATYKGFFNFLADLTDIMAMDYDSERESYFSVKEKKHFWEMLRLLEATKLTITLPYKGKWITVNHQMLGITITGAVQKDQELEVGYLDKVHYRVLSPDAFQEAAKWATEMATRISKGILTVPAEDIYFNLNLQIRAAQRQSYSGSQPLDEKYLIGVARIDKTHQANPSVGRKRLKEKLDRSKKAGIISDWEESEQKYIYKYNKSKKSNQKSESWSLSMSTISRSTY